jgi:hypothetical protein
MTRAKVIVVAWDDRLSEAETMARRLREAWPSPTPPAFEPAGGNSLEPDAFEQTDAVVVLAGEHSDDAMALSLLSMIEEAGVPVVALLDDEPTTADCCYKFAGALVQDSNVAIDVLVEQIRALCHRQTEVLRLRQEVALAHRLKGGLHGQMTKIHEELQLAANVQREFLPKDLPALHGVDFAAMWRASNYVSGDIYDVIRLDENHVGLFLADAIGHGVPAALMTMVICRALEVKEITGSNYRLVPPSEVLARLNSRLIHRQAASSRFVTAVYATIDCRRRVVTIAGAAPRCCRPTAGCSASSKTSSTTRRDASWRRVTGCSCTPTASSWSSPRRARTASSAP